MIDMTNKIDVTDLNLVKMVQEAYNLSLPVGMGMLHYTPDPLTDKEAQAILEPFKVDPRMAVGLDYVKGRCCTFNIHKDGDKLWISKEWYDHSPGQAEKLVSLVKAAEVENAAAPTG